MQIPLFSSMRFKVISVFLSLVFMLLVITGVTHWQIKRVEHLVTNRIMTRADARHLSKTLIIVIQHIYDEVKEYLREEDDIYKVSMLMSITDDVLQAEEHIKSTEQRNFVIVEKSLFDQIKEMFSKYRDQLNTLLETYDFEGTDGENTKKLSEEFAEEHTYFLSLLMQFDQLQSDLMYKARDQVESKMDYIRDILLILSVISLFLSIIFGFIITRKIANPILNLVNILKRYGQGNINVRAEINSNDEIGFFAKSFNEMVTNLQKTMVSKDYVDNIIESMGEGLIVISPKRDIVTLNEAFCSMTGYKRQDLIGKKIDSIFSHDMQSNESYSSSFDIIMNKGAISNLETHCINKAGEKIPVLFSGAAMRSKGKEDVVAIVSIVCVVRDITQRKKMEEDLKNAKQSLEEHHQQLHDAFDDMKKTHEELKTTQNQLLQSEKLASIGQLSAGIAHEINNPLGFISSNIEALESYIHSYMQVLDFSDQIRAAIASKDFEVAAAIVLQVKELEDRINYDFIKDDVYSLIKESKGGIERIKKIIMDLKTFARPDTESQKSSRIEEILDAAVNICWNEIKYWADLKKEYAHVSPIVCNSQKLVQVIVNLLVNASQAIPRDQRGLITIKTYEDNEYIYVDVKDSGKGIEQEHLRKIFDPFFTTKEIGVGTGLGLSVTYQIIKEQQGDIKVKSEIGKGTIFTISLPRYRKDLEPDRTKLLQDKE